MNFCLWRRDADQSPARDRHIQYIPEAPRNMGNVALGFGASPLVFPDIQKGRELSAYGKAGEGAPYI